MGGNYRKRIADVRQPCTSFRAAILGGIATLLALLFFGWYLVPLGGLGGILLRELRKLYEPDDVREEEKEAQFY